MASNMQYANLLLAMVLFADFPLLLPLRGCVCFFQTVNKQATPTSIHIVVGPRTLRRGTALVQKYRSNGSSQMLIGLYC